ncbi:hypothetical protein [Halostreptopolyspora alba]
MVWDPFPLGGRVAKRPVRALVGQPFLDPQSTVPDETRPWV